MFKKRKRSSRYVNSLEKFRLVGQFGIVVPHDYRHETRLDEFKRNYHCMFTGYNEDITDENFSQRTTVRLHPNQRLRVKIFDQVVSGRTTSIERLNFLLRHDALLTGAHGASLVFEQRRTELPKGKWYTSFDRKEALWRDSVRDHRVPELDAFLNGDFIFGLGRYEDDWTEISSMLCFCIE